MIENTDVADEIKPAVMAAGGFAGPLGPAPEQADNAVEEGSVEAEVHNS